MTVKTAKNIEISYILIYASLEISEHFPGCYCSLSVCFYFVNLNREVQILLYKEKVEGNVIPTLS